MWLNPIFLLSCHFRGSSYYLHGKRLLKNLLEAENSFLNHQSNNYKLLNSLKKGDREERDILSTKNLVNNQCKCVKWLAKFLMIFMRNIDQSFARRGYVQFLHILQKCKKKDLLVLDTFNCSITVTHSLFAKICSLLGIRLWWKWERWSSEKSLKNCGVVNATYTKGPETTLKNHSGNTASSLTYIFVFSIFLKNFKSYIENY